MYRNLIFGIDTLVPIRNGKKVPYINFDNGATTPPFSSVINGINNFAPWYSSIHRGTGYKSVLSSDFYDKSRNVVLNFVKGDPRYHEVIFVKNTTEAINKLSYRLFEEDKDDVILSTFMEHHSNDLPWRNKYKVDYIDIDTFGRLSLDDLEYKLKKYNGKVKLVAVTGASNVTGYINPIYKIARIAHKYNAKILVDGAQLIPHYPVDMKPINSNSHIDYLAFSAHKMYAPFGTGVLIGPRETFVKGDPEFVGGGTVSIVTPDFVIWENPPNKEEAGTPNIMGVVALMASIKNLRDIGMENIHEYEELLTNYTLEKIKNIPNINLYCDKTINNRVSIIPFNIEGIHHEIVAKILASEGGIAVRSGCFCAQPYIQKLLKIDPKDIEKYKDDLTLPRPGMVRVSFGLYNNFEEINIFIELLREIALNREKYNTKYRKPLFF